MIGVSIIDANLLYTDFFFAITFHLLQIKDKFWNDYNFIAIIKLFCFYTDKFTVECVEKKE